MNENKTNYEDDTLNAYKSVERASEYKRFHTKIFSWGRLMTILEQRKINNILKSYEWSQDDNLLDIPCGTGILGSLLKNYPFQVTASDISSEMMALAAAEYPEHCNVKLKQADITNTKFPAGSFSCLVSLGFLHRVPIEIKLATIKEIYALTNKIAIVTCSVKQPFFKLKQLILSYIHPNYLPAPCPMELNEIVSEFKKQGFNVKSSTMVLPVISAHTIFELEKI